MSNNNTAANPTVPETSGDLPFKLDVRVRPIAPMGNLLAYANVTIGGCFKIDGFRICSGEKGLYVNMPSTQDNKGNLEGCLLAGDGGFSPPSSMRR